MVADQQHRGAAGIGYPATKPTDYTIPTRRSVLKEQYARLTVIQALAERTSAQSASPRIAIQELASLIGDLASILKTVIEYEAEIVDETP